MPIILSAGLRDQLSVDSSSEGGKILVSPYIGSEPKEARIVALMEKSGHSSFSSRKTADIGLGFGMTAHISMSDFKILLERCMAEHTHIA